jgi:membrane protein implicated in regulation of membrane protease activity
VVEIEAADGGTLVRGEFVRHPHVFVISLAVIVVAVFAGLIALSWAVAQWSMGQAPTGLVGVAIAALVTVFAWRQSRSKLEGANEQTEELRKFIEDAVRAPLSY